MTNNSNNKKEMKTDINDLVDENGAEIPQKETVPEVVQASPLVRNVPLSSNERPKPKKAPKIHMTREEKELFMKDIDEEKAEKARLTVEGDVEMKKKKKAFFKWPAKKRSIMKKGVKKPDHILFFVLNLKKELEGPVLTKIYGGNFIVFRNHVYRYNPSRIFTMGKYKVAIGREYDRELVGIDDYNEVVAEGGNRSNIDDPVLIKAVIMAHLSEKAPVSSSTWIIVGIAVLAAIGAFIYFGSPSPTPVSAAAPVAAAVPAAVPAGYAPAVAA